MKTKVISIKDLKVGDKIKSYENGKIVYKPVLDVWDTVVEKERQVELLFTNGTLISCSTNHPIMVLENDEVIQKYPLELTQFDFIISDDEIVFLEEIKQGNNPTNYIDITVEGTNVFFASSNSETNMILTHNCSQGGIRGGAATLYYPLWHLEYENLIVLKNNKGTEETRSRHLDYGIQINDLMIKRFIKNDYITLFSPDAHPELYSAYFEDSEKFTKIYEALEKDPKVRKKRIRATEAFTLFMGERANTARIYPMFVDNVNEHGPFVRDIAPVKQSNLCIDGDALVNIRVGTNEDESTLKMKHLVKFFNSSSKDVFVESWDTIKNKRVWNKVKAAALMNPDAKVLKITGKGFDISTTPDHKFFTKDKGWLEAEFIDSQEVLNIKGKWVKANVRDDDEYIEVFDITVENSHCFFANNVLVHNCAEIALPTRDVGSDDPLVNLCTLSAFVLDSFDYQDQETIDRLSRIMVRALDNLLDYQEYPIAEALPSKRMRSLGVGVTNYAGWLASNYLSYRDSEEFTHELFERLQYSLIKASVGLAKEKGAAEDLAVSKYGQGLLPIDWYNKNVDELVAPNYVCDWESLRVDLKQYGIRNLTLTALMPCESSSQVSNSTNGIEPPRSAVTVKLSKDGAFRQVVPNIQELDDVYDYAWKLAKFGNKHYLKNVAIMQKFVDQSISANTYYIPHMFLKGKVPMSIMLDDLLYAWRFNVKTMYYHNTHDGSEDSSEDTPDDSDCAACKL